MNLKNHLGLFAKFWQPGRVKTRLAVMLGDQLACDVYFELLQHSLRLLAKTADRRTIVYSPTIQREAFSQLAGSNWHLTPQSDGDLGCRMNSFFAEAWREPNGTSVPLSVGPQNRISCPHVAVVGVDCPLLDHAIVERAFDLLDDYPVVIGPSTDGGYYLLAIRNQVTAREQIFQNIAWGTDEVLSRTLKVLKRNGIGFKLLSPLTDIDDGDDLSRLLVKLKEREDDETMGRLRQRLEMLLTSHN